MTNGYKKDYHLEKKFREFNDLRELIAHSADVYAEKTAFVTKVKTKTSDGQKSVNYINTTYKELYEQLCQLGTALMSKGYSGKRIGVMGENSYNWCLAYFAASCGIGVVVPLDKLLQKDELKSLIQRGDVSVVFADKKSYAVLEEIKNEGDTPLEVLYGLDFSPGEGLTIPELLDKGKTLMDSGDKSYIETPIDREAMSFLLFTSGTTQASKAVMLSHKNVTSVNFYMNCEEYFVPDDVCMLFLPLHHIFGMGGLIVFLSQGLKNVFCDGLKYISANFQEYGVSVMMTVPLLLENVYKKIWKGIDKQGKRSKVEMGMKICAASEKLGIYLRRKVFKEIIDQLGGRMRFFINGAAALDPVVAKGLNDLGILTVSGYGLTETSPTIASETYRYLKPGSVGKAMPFIDVDLFEKDENGIGEVIVKGDIVMMGYYNDRESTDAVLVDGWFHTGDLAYFDEDGYLFICGRKKNVIVMKNGKNVFPEEIETLVNNLPYVSESMLFSRNKASDVVLWMKVVYDEEYLKENNCTPEDVEKLLDKDLEEINNSMPAYKMVKHFYLSDKPTIKTTTQKTKRNDELKVIEQELEEKGLI